MLSFATPGLDGHVSFRFTRETQHLSPLSVTPTDLKRCCRKYVLEGTLDAQCLNVDSVALGRVCQRDELRHITAVTTSTFHKLKLLIQYAVGVVLCQSPRLADRGGRATVPDPSLL